MTATLAFLLSTAWLVLLVSGVGDFWPLIWLAALLAGGNLVQGLLTSRGRSRAAARRVPKAEEGKQ